jgi:serine/threonine protein kinase
MGCQRKFSFAEGQFIETTPYRVVRAIDLGGMGEVYEVDHTRTGTRRAIKVVRDLVDPRAQAAERLRQEGLALLSLDHPNVVRVYEIGMLPGNRPYFAMELLQGTTLRALLQHEGKLGLARSIDLTLQVLDGLQAVHEAGLIHRDIKPTNLMVCEGDRLKLLDFGVAKWMRGDSCVRTTTGQVLGTARYMAPEQLRGKAVDGRADLYAVALVLFEAVAGVHPFQAGLGATGSVVARLHRPAPRLSEVAGEPIPPAIDVVVSRALSLHPGDRFPTARSFARALRLASGGLCRPAPGPVVDANATTRVAPATVSFSGTASSVDPATIADAPAAIAKASDRAALPSCSARLAGVSDADRLRRLGVASSVCALVLGLSAALAATIAASDARFAPACSCNPCPEMSLHAND